jgi:hypothetical protein
MCFSFMALYWVQGESETGGWPIKLGLYLGNKRKTELPPILPDGNLQGGDLKHTAFCHPPASCTPAVYPGCPYLNP